MVVMVGAFIISHFMFPLVATHWGTSGKREWGGSVALFDMIFVNFMLTCLTFGVILFAVGLAYYVAQQRAWMQYFPNAVGDFGLFVPQDVTYITLWGLSCFQLMFVFKLLALFSSFASANTEQQKSLELGRPSALVHWWVTRLTAISAAAFYLFLGWYPYALWYAGVGLEPVYCLNGVCVDICPAAGCYDSNPYGPLLPFLGVTGLLLALDVFYTTFVPSRVTKDGRRAWSFADAHALDYKSALFYVGEGELLSTPMLAGYVPYFRLSYANILSNFFFVPLAITILTHDVVKGAIAAVLFSLLPMGFSLAAQDLGAYYSFQMAAIFHAIPFFYFASAVLQPACQTPVAGGARCTLLAPERLANFIEFGTMLTGPDSDANVLADIRTLQMFTYWAFGLISARLLYLLQMRDTGGVSVVALHGTGSVGTVKQS